MSNEQLASKNPPLDQIGIREGTDKSSLHGDYLRHYQRIFSELKSARFNLVEIGVFRGGSVRTWERFFKNAAIIGVDTDPSCRQYQTERIRIEIGSQNDPELLHRVAAAYPPTVVIDDGSHQSYDIIFTFERLFPALLPGGIYVIEDLHFHLLEHVVESLRGGSPILAHDYVLELAKDRLGSEAYVATLTGLRRHLVSSIDRIEIIGQMAIFYKKANKATSLEAFRALRPDVEASKSWSNWLSLSQRLLHAGAPSAEVIDALRQGTTLNPKMVVTYERLSEALERAGDIDGAIETLTDAITFGDISPGGAQALEGRIKRLRGLKT